MFLYSAPTLIFTSLTCTSLNLLLTNHQIHDDLELQRSLTCNFARVVFKIDIAIVNNIGLV